MKKTLSIVMMVVVVMVSFATAGAGDIVGQNPRDRHTEDVSQLYHWGNPVGQILAIDLDDTVYQVGAKSVHSLTTTGGGAGGGSTYLGYYNEVPFGIDAWSDPVTFWAKWTAADYGTGLHVLPEGETTNFTVWLGTSNAIGEWLINPTSTYTVTGLTVGFDWTYFELDMTDFVGSATWATANTLVFAVDGPTSPNGPCQLWIDDLFVIRAEDPVNPPFLMGDANGDGVVSAGDYAAVQANFGNTLPPQGAATPEPATVSLLTIGGIALLRRKRQ